MQATEKRIAALEQVNLKDGFAIPLIGGSFSVYRFDTIGFSQALRTLTSDFHKKQGKSTKNLTL